MLQCLRALAISFLIAPAVYAETVYYAAGNPDYPPSSWAYEGKMHGIAVELITRAARECNLNIKFITAGSWAETQALNKAGKIDILTTIYKNPQRQQFLNYMEQPYLWDENVVWVHSSFNHKVEQWSDLKSLNGGAIKGDSYGAEFDHFMQQLKIQRYPSDSHVLNALSEGVIDYFPYGKFSGQIAVTLAGLNSQLKSLPFTINREGLYIALHKDAKLQTDWPKLYQAIVRLIENGTADYLRQSSMANYLRQKQQANPPS